MKIPDKADITAVFMRDERAVGFFPDLAEVEAAAEQLNSTPGGDRYWVADFVPDDPRADPDPDDN